MIHRSWPMEQSIATVVERRTQRWRSSARIAARHFPVRPSRLRLRQLLQRFRQGRRVQPGSLYL
jgi:hypothetical protein